MLNISQKSSENNIAMFKKTGSKYCVAMTSKSNILNISRVLIGQGGFVEFLRLIILQLKITVSWIGESSSLKIYYCIC